MKGGITKMNNNILRKCIIIPDRSSIESQKYEGRYDIYKDQIVDNKTQKIWQRDWGLFQSVLYKSYYREFEKGAREAYGKISEMPEFKNMIPRNSNNDCFERASPFYRELEELLPENFGDSQSSIVKTLEDVGFKNVGEYPIFVRDTSLSCGQLGFQLTHDSTCYSQGIARLENKNIRRENVHRYLKDFDWMNHEVKGKFIFHSF